MGKQGPCCHCGVTSTPLWRNGPPEKPILCNACGSRWRTKGSLVNYTPLHARDYLELEELKVSKLKNICFKAKEQKLHKKNQNNGMIEFEREMPYSGQNFRKVFEGDTSNRSSSESALSYSESCAQFGTTDASELTGSAQSNAWDPLVPSKKRTCVARAKPSPVEKLTKDLCSIMHEQQSSCLSGSSEELLYESETPVGSFEIGYGSVLIRYPNSKTAEEESEASSFPIDNTSYVNNEAYLGSASFPVCTGSIGTSLSNVGVEKLKKSTAQVARVNVKRETVSPENLQILQDKESPLNLTALKDVKQKQIVGGKKMATGPNFLEQSYLTPLRRPHDSQIKQFQEMKGTMRSPKRVPKPGVMNLPSVKSTQLNSGDAASNVIQDVEEEFIYSEGACFSPRSIFATPPDRSSMLNPLQFTDESSDQDLLLDVPCINAPYPDAELIFHPWNQRRVSNNSPAESGVAEGEESLSKNLIL